MDDRCALDSDNFSHEPSYVSERSAKAPVVSVDDGLMLLIGGAVRS